MLYIVGKSTARRLNCFLFTMPFCFHKCAHIAPFWPCALALVTQFCSFTGRGLRHWFAFFLSGELLSVTWEAMNGSNLEVIDLVWHVTDTTISACLWLSPGLPWQPERQHSGFILYGTLAGVWRAVFLCLLQLCLYANHRCKCLRPHFVTL